MAKKVIKFDQSTGLVVTQTGPDEYTVQQQTIVGDAGPTGPAGPADPFTLMAGAPKPHTHPVSDVIGASTSTASADPLTVVPHPPHMHLVSDVIGAGTGSSSLVFSKGIEASKPALAEGEMYWATDTDTLFIGT